MKSVSYFDRLVFNLTWCRCEDIFNFTDGEQMTESIFKNSTGASGHHLTPGLLPNVSRYLQADSLPKSYRYKKYICDCTVHRRAMTDYCSLITVA